MTHAEGPAVSPPDRGLTIGAVVGALPQALLLTLMLLGVATADNLAERQTYGLLVWPEVTIVPISVLIGLVCLSQPASRPFGRGGAPWPAP